MDVLERLREMIKQGFPDIKEKELTSRLEIAKKILNKGVLPQKRLTQ